MVEVTAFAASSTVPCRHTVCGRLLCPGLRLRNQAYPVVVKRRQFKAFPTALTDNYVSAHTSPVLLAVSDKIYGKIFLGSFGIMIATIISTVIVGIIIRIKYDEVCPHLR